MNDDTSLGVTHEEIESLIDELEKEDGVVFNDNTSKSSTDVIISQYESIMSRNIASKSLKSATTGEAPTFTKEEMAYLTKKAVDESSFAEVKVITPAPTITLKKGNTEINVKNAAAVVRKMEEKYPKNSVERPSTFDCGVREEVPFVSPNPIIPQHTEIKSVNKNAYEIRLDVLKEATTFLNWTTECSRVDGKYPNVPTSDDVLNLAQRFYKFVEQRR